MSSIERKSGFTLLEVTAAMLIIALVSALVIAAWPGTGRAGLKAVTLETAAMLRHERAAAILTGRTRYVWLDHERRMLVGDSGDRVAIPRDVVLDLLSAEALRDGRGSIALFDPDGTSSGAALRLSRDELGYEVRVNWYTGGVAIVASQH